MDLSPGAFAAIAPSEPGAPAPAIVFALPQPHFAWRVLDEIDYGLILVNPRGQVQHANHLARRELAAEHFLRVQERQLAGAGAEQTEELQRGIRGAAQGRRQMVNLRAGAKVLPVACVPLLSPLEAEPTSVLLMLGRQVGTQNLAMAFFARTHGLTPAEESVLRGLCQGLDVKEIAAEHRVSEFTIRTQVRALRDKTQSGSIRLLVQRVAALPPVVPSVLQ
jgi:DNA-binding CsgD family transcriptional regulator